eukprot:CAMPEP_0184327688 /NCGR_PEP_ID=MMETSP1049-20130417/143218_1 /TAXON_ID=77928 /ORGANISM="Proteomonas sulcata, Strain CCMP704" /LENGTH=662 /DNA_ID=CAMNT_0026649953 /DNA_START=20 /DNA_END=2008 /DNA_ORIENTATION=+
MTDAATPVAEPERMRQGDVAMELRHPLPTNPALLAISNYFGINRRGSTFATEIRAGITTFLTMSYVLAVNSRIISESGGPCECPAATIDDPACVFYDPEYAQCVEEFRREMVTVTALSAMVGCFLMGFGANLPLALAPGMGMNAYFTYDVVGFHGTGNVKWDVAMAAIFIEGLIFVFLTITGLRKMLVYYLPECIKTAMTGGIGLFLAHLGLQTAEGIGLVVADIATAITLGGCPEANRTYAMYDGLSADAYTCDNYPGSKMTSATTYLGIITVILIGVLLKRNIKGAIILGVAFACIISWFKNSKVSYFEDDVYAAGGGDGLSGGEYRWRYFKQVVKLETLEMSAGQMNFSSGSASLATALITFLYVDLLDTTGTLIAMTKFAGLMDEDGHFENENYAFLVDGSATTIGACLGSSPVTTFIESGSGIEEGGRTGLTALVCGVLYFISIFFAPILASLPPWSTGPALIVVGSMMMKAVTTIEWGDYGQAIPSFLCIVLMPLTYSIAYGIIGGILSYVLINGLDWCIDFAMGRAKFPEFEWQDGMPVPKQDRASNSSSDTPEAETKADAKIDGSESVAPMAPMGVPPGMPPHMMPPMGQPGQMPMMPGQMPAQPYMAPAMNTLAGGPPAPGMNTQFVYPMGQSADPAFMPMAGQPQMQHQGMA